MEPSDPDHHVRDRIQAATEVSGDSIFQVVDVSNMGEQQMTISDVDTPVSTMTSDTTTAEEANGDEVSGLNATTANHAPTEQQMTTPDVNTPSSTTAGDDEDGADGAGSSISIGNHASTEHQVITLDVDTLNITITSASNTVEDTDGDGGSVFVSNTIDGNDASTEQQMTTLDVDTFSITSTVVANTAEESDGYESTDSNATIGDYASTEQTEDNLPAVGSNASILDNVNSTNGHHAATEQTEGNLAIHRHPCTTVSNADYSMAFDAGDISSDDSFYASDASLDRLRDEEHIENDPRCQHCFDSITEIPDGPIGRSRFMITRYVCYEDQSNVAPEFLDSLSEPEVIELMTVVVPRDWTSDSMPEVPATVQLARFAAQARINVAARNAACPHLAPSSRFRFVHLDNAVEDAEAVEDADTDDAAVSDRLEDELSPSELLWFPGFPPRSDEGDDDDDGNVNAGGDPTRNTDNPNRHYFEDDTSDESDADTGNTGTNNNNTAAASDRQVVIRRAVPDGFTPVAGGSSSSSSGSEDGDDDEEDQDTGHDDNGTKPRKKKDKGKAVDRVVYSGGSSTDDGDSSSSDTPDSDDQDAEAPAISRKDKGKAPERVIDLSGPLPIVAGPSSSSSSAGPSEAHGQAIDDNATATAARRTTMHPYYGSADNIPYAGPSSIMLSRPISNSNNANDNGSGSNNNDNNPAAREAELERRSEEMTSRSARNDEDNSSLIMTFRVSDMRRKMKEQECRKFRNTLQRMWWEAQIHDAANCSSSTTMTTTATTATTTHQTASATGTAIAPTTAAASDDGVVDEAGHDHAAVDADEDDGDDNETSAAVEEENDDGHGGDEGEESDYYN